MRALGAGVGLIGMLLTMGIIGYLLFGAGGSSSTTPEGSGAPGQPRRPGYVGGMLDAKDSVQAQTALAAVRQRVQAYQALNGSFPASLDDLVKKSGQPLPELPPGRTWTYDAATGHVDVK
jgi:hypothetical protein